MLVLVIEHWWDPKGRQSKYFNVHFKKNNEYIFLAHTSQVDYYNLA